MFGNAHQAVVKQDGIVGLAKRAYFTRLVDAVPLFYIVQNVFEGSFLSFRFQLIVAAAGTDFGRCRNEDFQFGIGEDGSSYVASMTMPFSLPMACCCLTSAWRTNPRAATGLT